MHFIEDKSVFREAMQSLGHLIDPSRRFPAQVRKSGVSSFLFFECDIIFDTAFFQQLCTFMARAGTAPCLLAMLDPEPEDFCRHFGTYPLLELSPEDDAEAYLQCVWADPGGSPADALASIAAIVTIFPHGGRWVIYGDRSLEVAMACFHTPADMATFQTVFKEAYLMNAEDVVAAIFALVFIHSPTGVPADLIKTFLKNYGGV